MRLFLTNVSFSLVCLFLVNGCDDMFEYHPYDSNVGPGYRNINEKNIKRINENDKGIDTFRFVFMGDSHRYLDETRDFANAVNRMENVSFVVHGGDLTDYALKKEFMWAHDQMSRLHIPYVAVVGNHDLLGSGEELYELMYGEMNFSFVFGRVKFVCLNTNALEFDYSESVPNFKYIQSIYENPDPKCDRTVVVMHTEPGDVEFNNDLDYLYEQEISRLKNLKFCLFAHVHRLTDADIMGDGIRYISCESMEDRSFLLFDVKGDDISYEVVRF